VKPDLVQGSPQWQAIFLAVAAAILLLQVLRGWHLGLPRQLVRIGALIAAYCAALFGGSALLPFLRPIINAPDVILSAIGGLVLALIVYIAINSIGIILFKRTGQQELAAVRLMYGMSGAFLGLLFGLFFIWILLVGIRSLGAIAEAQINARAQERISQNSFPMLLARLKNSVELGRTGDVVRQTDVLPGGVYETLGKVGEVFARPERATRFFSYPGITQLADHPRILALRADPEVARMLEEGRLWALLQDDRLIETVNDPDLARQVRSINLRAALDHALED
jgi:hypothetical protein